MLEWKTIPRLNSLVSCSPSPNSGDLVQREHPRNLGGIRVGLFSEQKNLQYHWNEARYDPGYYWWLIGSCIRAFDLYQNQRPWITLNGLSFKMQAYTKYRVNEPIKLRTKVGSVFDEWQTIRAFRVVLLEFPLHCVILVGTCRQRLYAYTNNNMHTAQQAG